MVFNPNVPSTGNRINQQYLIVQNNFATSNTLYALDHYAWNDATPALRGLHRKLTLIQQAADPAASASGGIAYSKKNPSATVTRTDPYYRFESGALGNGMIAPMVPFKVFGVFNNVIANPVVPVADIFQSYNVLQINYVASGFFNLFTVNFTNQLDNAAAGQPADLVIFCDLVATTTVTNPTQVTKPVIRNVKNNSFEILAVNSVNLPQISFGVIQF